MKNVLAFGFSRSVAWQTVATLFLLAAHLTEAQTCQFGFDANGNLYSQISEISAGPTIIGQPQTQIVAPGETASFSVVVADTRSLSYQWQFNGAAIAGATTDALLLTDVTANNEGQYTVVLVNGSGTLNSAPAALMIDSRGCGMPDSWQLAHFGNLAQNATGDFDGDGVANLQEFLDGTDPANAASVLYRIALVSDGETVVVAPDQPTYTNGQVVTLTATGSAAAPFYGWTEDVVTRSSSISVVMTNNKTLFAHFLPMSFQWTNAVGGDWNGATNWTPNLAPGSNDTVVIARGIVVTLNSNVDLADFTFGIGNNAPELTGTGALTVHGTCLWQTGVMSGSGRTMIAPGATLNISNANAISLANRTLENAGMVLWSATSPIEINGGVITNDAGAMFVMQNQNSILFGGGLPRFDNVGTFLTSTNPGTTDFSSVAFDNYGTVQIQGGTLALAGGGINAGIITVPAGTGISFSGAFTSGGSSSITGAGTFAVNGGTATLAGAINVTGSNVFSSGSVDLTGNYVCTNTMLISGATANFDGTGTVSPSLLNLSNGSLGGSQTVTVQSVMNWTGGSMSGSGRTVIPPGVTLNIGSGAGLAVNNRTLDNGGTALWSGGNMNINAGVITNEAGALFQVQNPGTFAFGGGSPRFDNAGTFRITGAGTTFFAIVNFNNYGDTQIQGGILDLFGGLNNGTMEFPAGTALQFAGGTFTSSAASTISGAGALVVNNGTTTLAGTVNLAGSNMFTGGTVGFTGNYTCTNGMVISGATANFDGTGTVSPSLLNLSNGSLGGSQTVTVQSVMNWTGGSMSGSGRTVIPPGVTLNIGSGAGLAVNNRTLDNGGTALWSGGNMNINAGVITNEAGALFQVQNPGTFAFGGGSPRFDNAGTFRTTGAGTTFFAIVNFNNYGDTQIQGGTFELFGGLNNGTMEFPAGTTLQFAGGTFTSSATSAISGAGALLVNNGTTTLAGTVNLAGSNVFTGGSVDFTGNYICTNVMVISGAAASFNGTGAVSPLQLNLSSDGGGLGGSQTVTVGSVMNWTGASMTGDGRTVISAGATLNIGGNPFSPFSITGRTLDNAGTAIWTGPGLISLNAATITNRAGALFNPQNASSIIFGGGAPRFDNAGTFRKSVSTGTTDLSSVSFMNYGTVDIQSGFFAPNGGYVSSSNAVLNCALSGTTPGTNYGQLHVSGSITLNGTLSVNLTNNYIPTINDSFTVLSAGTRNGTFANFVYPSNKVSMLSSNTSNSVIVSVGNVFVVPEPLLSPPQISGSNVLLIWTAVPNTTYRVEFNPDLNPSNWNALPET